MKSSMGVVGRKLGGYTSEISSHTASKIFHG